MEATSGLFTLRSKWLLALSAGDCENLPRGPGVCAMTQPRGQAGLGRGRAACPRVESQTAPLRVSAGERSAVTRGDRGGFPGKCWAFGLCLQLKGRSLGVLGLETRQWGALEAGTRQKPAGPVTPGGRMAGLGLTRWRKVCAPELPAGTRAVHRPTAVAGSPGYP